MQYQGNSGVEAAPTNEQNDRRTYSVPEVAGMWGVHPATVYREVKAGHIRAIRIGAKRGVVRIPIAAVGEYEALSAITGEDLAEVA